MSRFGREKTIKDHTSDSGNRLEGLAVLVMILGSCPKWCESSWTSVDNGNPMSRLCPSREENQPFQQVEMSWNRSRESKPEMPSGIFDRV